MIRKILLVAVVLAIISGGTVFALDMIGSQQKGEAREQTIEFETRAENKKIIKETVDPSKPDEIRREWTGDDGLIYKIEAIRNEDGSYTGNIVGTNPKDNFIESNFKFDRFTERAFEALMDK